MLALSPVYPSWTSPGRQASVSPGPLSAQVGLTESRLVAWRPWTWWGAIRELGRLRPVVIVFQWWHPMFAPAYVAVATAARRLGAHVLIVCHNAEPHERFPLAGPLTSSALNRADSLLVLSDAVGAAIRRLSPKSRVILLSHPPYTALLRPVDSEAEDRWRRRIEAGDRPVVLFFGNVRKYKGLGDLIAAFPNVRSQTSAVLVVAGTFFESEDEFSRQIAELKLQDDVKLFPGYVPDEEVAALFRVSDLVVLPYRTGSQTGIAPLAAALGRPVVSTAAGGISEGAPTTRVAPTGNPIGLADTIVSSLRNPDAVVWSTTTWAEWAGTILSSARVK